MFCVLRSLRRRFFRGQPDFRLLCAVPDQPAAYRSCQFCKSAFRCGSGSGGKLFYSCIFKRIAKSEKRDFLCGDSSGYGELWMQCKRTEKSDFENACISWMQLPAGRLSFCVFTKSKERHFYIWSNNDMLLLDFIHRHKTL